MEAIESKREPLNLNEITGYNEAQKSKPKEDPNKLDNTAFYALIFGAIKKSRPHFSDGNRQNHHANRATYASRNARASQKDDD